MVIELDGPSHFNIDERGELSSSSTSLAKHRMLRSAFKHVIVVHGNLASLDMNGFDDSMEEL